MFATKCLRASAAHAERVPMIKFMGRRSLPASVDHTPRAHPASPSHELPADFTQNSSASFSSYRQKAQQHGPLGRANTRANGGLGSVSGNSLGPVAPTKGEYFDRNELPARFRRQPIDLSEIDAIETGGATLVC